MGVGEPRLPENRPGIRRGQPAGELRRRLYVLKVSCRWCDCPGRVRAISDGLQPLVTPWLMVQAARRAGRYRRGHEKHRDRQRLCERTACRVGTNRGRSAQAIGLLAWRLGDQCPRARDIIGRPYALILTAGKVSDIKAAPALLGAPGVCATCGLTRVTTPPACGAHCAKRGRSRHPRSRQPQAHHPLRQGSLPRPPPCRKRPLPSQRLPSGRHPLRQARWTLPLTRGAHSALASRCERV